MREIWFILVVILISIIAVAINTRFELASKYAVKGITKPGLTELLTDFEKEYGKHYISKRHDD